MRKAKKKREIVEKNGKFYTKRGVELTHNANTMTTAEYFAMILSALRRTTRFWKPAMKHLEAGKRINESRNKRLKYEYHCESCDKWFKKADIQLDHIVPCGGVNGYDKIVPWLKKAHIETGYQRLCKPCHRIKTKEERK